MKMKKWTTIILVLLGCFLMSSCQNSTKQNNFHYEKQEKNLVLETGVCDAYFKGNYCYILTLDGLTKTDLLSNNTEKIPISAGEYSNVVKYTVSDNGSLYLLVKRGEGVFGIECFDENGIQKYSMEVNEFEQIPNKFEADTNGNLFFLTDNKLIILAYNGEIYKIDEFVYIQDFVIGDNCFYVAGVLQTERVICSYNSADGKKMETYTQVPDVSAGNGLFYSEDGIIVNSGVELLKQKNEYEELLQLTKFGIDGADLISVFFHEKKIYVVFYDETEDTYMLANFEKKDGGEEILTFAVYYIDSNLKQQVIDYNKNSNDVKIEIRDYSAYSYDEAVKKMNIDIVSGNTPDIISLTTFDEVRQYAKKGLLADLSGVVDEYAGADEELFMNVLDASRINGHLYSVMPEFSMRVLLGRIGSQDGKLDYEDIVDFDGQGSETVFYAQNSEMFLIYTLIGTMENYVNYEEKNVSLERISLKKL